MSMLVLPPPAAPPRVVQSDMRLLRLYEAGLPAWAVFLPTYGEGGRVSGAGGRPHCQRWSTPALACRPLAPRPPSPTSCLQDPCCPWAACAQSCLLMQLRPDSALFPLALFHLALAHLALAHLLNRAYWHINPFI